MLYFGVQVLKFLRLVKGNRSIFLTTMSFVIFAATAAIANAADKLLSAEAMKPTPAELAGAFER
jgi:F0F1-type ATP synthase assembly protein I